MVTHSKKQHFVMTVKSPIPQQQQLLWSVTLIQWIVAWIILLWSFTFKEQDKLGQQNNCIYPENTDLLW